MAEHQAFALVWTDADSAASFRLTSELAPSSVVATSDSQSEADWDVLTDVIEGRNAEIIGTPVRVTGLIREDDALAIPGEVHARTIESWDFPGQSSFSVEAWVEVA